MKQHDRQMLDRVAVYVQAHTKDEATGHDWSHIERVRRMSLHLAHTESVADTTLVELSALLHDVPDYKFHNNDKEAGARHLRDVMTELKISPEYFEPVIAITTHVSYLGAGVPDTLTRIEGQIVQDADRLDAMGAVGIARCFVWGAQHNEAMYEPAQKVKLHRSQEEYIGYRSTSINHFYEKLLLLQDRLHTAEAKRIGARRHALMQNFVRDFIQEWEGTYD